MHFLPQPCRSHSVYTSILHAGFAYHLTKLRCFISKKTDSYCKYVTRVFFFSLNGAWVNERFVLCVSTFVNGLAIGFFLPQIPSLSYTSLIPHVSFFLALF